MHDERKMGIIAIFFTWLRQVKVNSIQCNAMHDEREREREMDREFTWLRSMRSSREMSGVEISRASSGRRCRRIGERIGNDEGSSALGLGTKKKAGGGGSSSSRFSRLSFSPLSCRNPSTLEMRGTLKPSTLTTRSTSLV
jgi:hypothetical protein